MAHGGRGWQADLTLRCQRQQQRTILGQCTHHGPLRVQRPFYPEGDSPCHIALLHPPGGIVGGDELRVTVTVEANAHALLTTPAATKFYRSAGATAQQSQRLTVATGAALEWLPQESIVYSSARAHSVTRVDLEADAVFLGWEIVCLGRPAAGEAFTAGYYRHDFELWRAEEPLYVERGQYLGGTPGLAAIWGLQGQPVFATFIVAAPPPGAIAAIRTQWSALPASAAIIETIAVTSLDGVLICRYVGASTARARQLFILAWSLLRPLLLQRPPCPSRFWNT
jgi:urease accessory protein